MAKKKKKKTQTQAQAQTETKKTRKGRRADLRIEKLETVLGPESSEGETQWRQAGKGYKDRKAALDAAAKLGLGHYRIIDVKQEFDVEEETTRKIV